MTFTGLTGVPDYSIDSFGDKNSAYCLLIPVINEGERILTELARAQKAGVDKLCDILICDGGSTDGSMEQEKLKALGVNGLLTKLGPGKQGAQLRMGISYALGRGYEGILTIDGNNKDSIEDAVKFIEKLDEGYDFIQGSRFIEGGQAINTPISRHLAVKYIHSPIISITAKDKFTDTTNNFRGYSAKYLLHPLVQPFRNVFRTYELLAYLSTRASQLKLRTCEVPVTRAYPNTGKIPTKISPLKGNAELMKILLANAAGKYNP